MPSNDGCSPAFLFTKTMSGSKFNRKASSSGRLAAVLALYEIDLVGADVDEVLLSYKDRRWKAFQTELTQTLIEEEEEDVSQPLPDRSVLPLIVRGVLAERDNLDEILQPCLCGEDRRVESFQELVRAVLRAAAYEIIHRKSVPFGTISGDYVAIANAFFNDNQPGVVNAVLSALGRKERPPTLNKNFRNIRDY